MLAHTARRLFYALITIVLTSFVIFWILWLSPADFNPFPIGAQPPAASGQTVLAQMSLPQTDAVQATEVRTLGQIPAQTPGQIPAQTLVQTAAAPSADPQLFSFQRRTVTC